jgi:glucose-1-phosphate adenylyltransferase
MMKNNEIALILAGGQGKRMDTLCYLRPKPLLPFAGKYRVIDFTLSNCIHSKISEIAVLVDYQRESMAAYLDGWHAVNGVATGLRILPPKADSYAGTADAVFQNHAYLETRESDTVLVLAGDHVYKMDYRKMIDFHRKTKAGVTIGVVRVPLEEAHRFGTVAIDGAGRVKEFKEKSSASSSNLASMGIYVFDKDLLLKRLYEDTIETDSLHDFGYNILPRMLQTDRVFAYEFKNDWHDIGTIDAYYQTSMELLRPRSHITLDKGWPVLNENIFMPEFKMNQEGSIVNSLISPGCIIEGRVENSILSPGVKVDEQALVRNSVIMAGARIGYYSVVDGCIIDENVNIGKFCYVGFGAGVSSQNLKVTVVGKDVSVPDHVAIGRQCNVKPGLGPDAFNRHLIPSGTTVINIE